MTWELHWRGATYSESQVIGADLAAAQMCAPALGWGACDPLAGPIQAGNMVAVLAARIDGRDFDEVIEELGAAPAVELARLVRRVEEPKPDLSAAALAVA